MCVGDRSYLLCFRRLLQQYVVDMYIKLETMRLDYLRRHQDDLRTECYQGLLDSVVSGVREGAVSGGGGAFFVDGPGGTGKSFLYRVLLAHIRSLGKIAIVVATSGITASAFPGGRTAHSRFKIPITVVKGVRCQMSVQSSEAHLMKCETIIIWDEAPMADKCIIEAVDKLMQELCGNRMLFGGKLIVFGGDFR
ncbi:hypothetical protein LIER_33147 [Lithospermum erythrorhizon]|uniref:ATP-dependent DNA helicase n=1 Tax=Lithospermum erythrorhizon TaxID=34254 RepID=A0AAV3RWS5_LITER